MILRLSQIIQEKSGRRILDSLDLCVEEGSFFVLMGPTGCGKTTLLRIAGLIDRPSSGMVEIFGGEVPGGGRGRFEVRGEVTTVFQRPVLFRGTVFSNIRWGLKIRGVGSPEMESRISRVLDMVGLEGYENRDSATLSGGELQRVALARALVLEPRILLLDEPTTSVDQNLRISLIRRIARLHRETGITFIMATHDFTEALALGTSGAVMRQGAIEQSGSMDEIFFNPSSPFMASFVGMRNIFSADFAGETAKAGNLKIVHSGIRNGHGFLAVSPESVVISREQTRTSERNRFSGEIHSIMKSGRGFEVTVQCRDIKLTAALTRDSVMELGLELGMEVFVSFKAGAVHVF